MCVQRHILYVYVVECSYIHSFVGYVCLHTHAIALLVVCYVVYNAYTELLCTVMCLLCVGVGEGGLHMLT